MGGGGGAGPARLSDEDLEVGAGAARRDGPRRGGRYQPGTARPPIDDRFEAASDHGDVIPVVAISLWMCGCGFGNFPSRSRCRLCMAARRFDESRKQEFWARSRLPRGAERELVLEGGAAPPARAPAARPKRIPGAPPTRAASRGARVQQPHQQQLQQQQQQQQQQQRAQQPPAPRLQPTPAPRGPPAATPAEGSGSGGDAAASWVQVARRKKGKQRARPDTAEPGDEHVDGGGGGGGVGRENAAPRGGHLPSPLEWATPPLPRKLLGQLHSAAAARADKQKEKGNDQKAQKAREEEQRLGDWYKQAGGQKSLELQVKKDRAKLDAAQRNAKKAQGEIERMELQIVSLREAIAREADKQKAYEDKAQVLRGRVAYASAQMHAEALAPSEERDLQLARAKLEESGDPVYSSLLRILATMVPPPLGTEYHNFAEDDSSSSATDFDMEQGDVTFVGARCDLGPVGGGTSGDTAPSPLAYARRRLEELLEEKEAALMHANRKHNQRQQNKRNREGDSKEGDSQGDVDLVPPVSDGWLRAHFDRKIEEARDELHRLEHEMGERIPVPIIADDAAHESHGHDPPHHQQAAAAAAAPACTSGGRDAARAGATPAAASRDAELLRVREVNVAIQRQNLEQAIQDMEIEKARMEANGIDSGLWLASRSEEDRMRDRAAAEALESPLAVYGPTGTSLAEQQHAMRAAADAGGLRGRTTRWERLDEGDDHGRSMEERERSPRPGRREAGSADGKDSDAGDAASALVR